MDIELTQAQLAFRDEARAFVDAHLPPALRRKMRLGHVPDRQDIVDWQRTLHRKGWAAPHWPRQYGGADLGLVERILLQEELYRAPAPQPLSMNVSMLGPVLLHFGTEEMKQHWLPKLANLDTWFCQGFSEPGSGSDLASLRTAAVRDGDHYVVNGQKIWTTTAHWADWIFCLVRTSREARKQDGISMLLIDLRSPGVVIRPIRSIDGHHHFNEVFFEGVRVPAGNLIGQEGRGWDCTKFLLTHERALVAKIGFCYERLDRVRELLEERGVGGSARVRIEDELNLLRAEIRAMEMLQWRMVGLDPDDARAGDLASVLKIKGTDIQQRIAALLYRVEGTRAMAQKALADAPEAPTVGSYYHYVRAVTIYGGTNEIQRELLNRGMF
jgi:pimeloyl-CoA dehydrogenase